MNTFSTLKKALIDQIQLMETNRKDFVKNPLSDFTRKRKLSFSDTIQMILSMECGSIRSELLKYFSYSPDIATTSAFIQQRDKLKPETFQHLFHSFNSTLPQKNWNGFHFFAVDGSDVLIPLEGDNEVYGYFHREDQRNYHQVHLNAIYDLINHRYSDAYIEPRKGHNEREAFHHMLEEHSFPEKSVFIFDRGYECYPLMSHISGKNQFFVMRAKDNKPGGILNGINLPQENEYDFLFNKILTNRFRVAHLDNPGAYHYVHYKPSPYFLNKDVKELPFSFRIVRFRLKNGSYECLLTNLPKEIFDRASLKKIYNMRWGIETSFCRLKYSIGLLYFHSKKVESIQQEIWARLILHNFCMAVTEDIKVRKTNSRYRYQLNIVNAIQICRRFLKGCTAEAPPDIELLISRVLLPIRPKRNNTRKGTTKRPRKFNYRVL